MAGTRVTIGSGSEFEATVGYSRVVRTGPWVAVAGTTGGAGDIATQTRQALRRIELALDQAGASLADVVRTRMFVTDISRWEEFGRAHGEYFRDVLPCATMVEISRLIDDRMLIEIEVDAVLP